MQKQRIPPSLLVCASSSAMILVSNIVPSVRSRGTEIEFWTPCDMLYQRKMPTMFLGDSPFFCFELNYIWEIAFSPTKGEYNEYPSILANIVHEVLKHVSDISWGYVIHIQPRTLLVVLVDVGVYIHQNHSTCPDRTYEPLPITIVKSPKRQGF